MKYIFSGPALDLVLRENRIRIQRGDLVVTPFEEGVEDSKTAEVEDTKEIVVADKKKPVKKGKKQ